MGQNARIPLTYRIYLYKIEVLFSEQIFTSQILKRAFVKEVHRDENDISAEEKTEIQSSWIQSQNENKRRKKSDSCKKSKR